MKQKLREIGQRHFPALAKLYLEARSKRTFVTEKVPYGFTLSSPPVMLRPGWEVREKAFLLDALRKSDVFVDVGANIGFYTCLAAQNGVDVVAFEPVPNNLATLCRNIETNGFTNVEVMALALSDAVGVRRIFGLTDQASFYKGKDEVSTLVPTNSLDNIIASRFAGKRLLIKVDVEGAEDVVLSGAMATMALTPRPVWLMEVLKPAQSTVFKRFFEAGYKCRAMKADVEVTSTDENLQGDNFAFYDSHFEPNRSSQ
jgi:FkbM family methyltransferase